MQEWKPFKISSVEVRSDYSEILEAAGLDSEQIIILEAILFRCEKDGISRIPFQRLRRLASPWLPSDDLILILKDLEGFEFFKWIPRPKLKLAHKPGLNRKMRKMLAHQAIQENLFEVLKESGPDHFEINPEIARRTVHHY